MSVLATRVMAALTPTTTSAAPTRDPGELYVVWRLVEAQERNGGRVGAFSLLPGANTDPAWKNHCRDFSNFLRFGSSSLTPYEARTLAFGLGFTPDTGDQRISNNTAGDRVAFTARGLGAVESGQGILIDHRTILVGNVGSPWSLPSVSVRYLHDNDGSSSCTIDRVISPALVDGR